ncbi:MAG: DUF4352 domain-containing protein [Clostridia bacterium]|nr:DUF4352 domain-containing protein [Clostridia bacterium]
MKERKVIGVVLSVLCACLVFVGCSSSNVSTSNTNNDSGNSANTEQSKGAEISTYKLNEDIFITNSSGKYRVKFTKISETKDRNEFSDTKADRVVIIEYEYENLELNEDLYVSEMSFKLYDKSNEQLETYPVDTKYASNISKGRKTTASVAYALNNSENYIELEYYDNMFNSKPDCKVVFEW